MTTERQVAVVQETTYDFDGLMKEFNTLVSKLMADNQSNAYKITAIVDKYLGKGKKVSDASPEQAELVALIVDDIKAELM